MLNKPHTGVVMPEDAWPEVDISFLEKGDEVEPIDYKYIFGEKLAKLIEETAEACSCSKEYIMLSLLVLSGVIIAHKRRVKVREGWEEPSVIWGLLVGNPSCRKSVSMTPFYKALEPLNARRVAEYELLKSIYLDRVKDIKSNKEDKSIWDDLIRELNKPILDQIVLGDTTMEGLLKTINPKNPTGSCLFRDEFDGILKNAQSYNNGNKTGFTEGYNGNQYILNRAGKDEPIIIPELLIALLGGIQPEVLAEIMEAADDGFMSRFLFAYSEPKKIDVMGDGFVFDISLLTRIFNRLDTEIIGKKASTTRVDELDTKVIVKKSLTLSDEAKLVLQEFINKHHEDQECVSGLLASSYGKMHGQMLRIACVLEHLFWAVESDREPPIEITADTLKKARNLMEFYFKPMAGKMLSECKKYRKNVPPLEKFIKHLAESKESSFNWRGIVGRGAFKQLKDKKDGIINFLTERNIIRRIVCVSSGGRPKEEYRINPGLKSAFVDLLSDEGDKTHEDVQI